MCAEHDVEQVNHQLERVVLCLTLHPLQVPEGSVGGERFTRKKKKKYR